jgi:para-aminobenzoate synthetase / 4-amino-4-deoxychorismate lyase
MLTAYSPVEVLPTLTKIERLANENRLYAAGYLSYEAATGLDECLTTRSPGQLPLLCFGLFDEPDRLDQLPAPPGVGRSLSQWTMTTTYETYLDSIQEIKREIALGNSYQINFTIRQYADDMLDPWTFFLHTAGDAPYAAFIEFDQFAIVSASPELFFRLDQDSLLCRPMKGTAERGLTLEADYDQRHKLRCSTKDRAENVMVTDMLRSDMGRVATPGTVKVTSLFDIEKYPTVWQMTSSITARTTVSVTKILRALFPCASVTGAPKASSMGIIAELEDSPREIYTGTIGYFSPDRVAQFNVAIRTAWVNHETHQATYGTGGGIVWDSVAESEYRECQAKTKVLAGSAADKDFELLETMRWTADEGFFLLGQHLDRLRDSADYFDFRFERADIETALATLGDCAGPDACRVRLLVQRDGTFQLTREALANTQSEPPPRIRLAAEAIDIMNPFFYHKTTRRSAYTQAKMSVSDCDDVLLWNPDGYVTETTIANVVVRFGNELLTPPTRSGLLAGTFRQQLLRQGIIRERNIHRDDLSTNQPVMLINSVRGWYTGRLSGD